MPGHLCPGHDSCSKYKGIWEPCTGQGIVEVGTSILLDCIWAKQPLRFKIDEDEGAKWVGLSAVVFWKRDLDFTLGSGISFLLLLEVSSFLMIIKLTFFNFRLRSG